MKIKNLQDVEILVRTADTGGLSAAARYLDISPAVASASLKRLETDLGTALFVRTTRSMRLTPQGARLLPRCRALLDELLEAEAELADDHGAVRGNMHISMPSDLGRNVLLPWLDEFQKLHPAIRLQLQLSDRLANVYRELVDMAIRYGVPPDSALVALPLLQENYRVLCAAPVYLDTHGEPESPEDLVRHNCLCFIIDKSLYNRWQFTKGGKTVAVEVSGDRTADDSDAVRRWALAGHGVMYRSRIDVLEDLAAGRLRMICSSWQGENLPLYLVCADRRQLSPAVRRLREFLERRCREMTERFSVLT